MPAFKGFPEGKVRLTPVPSLLISELLPEIDHLGELKVILYTLWRLDRLEGGFRYLTRAAYLEDTRFVTSLADGDQSGDEALDEALRRAVGRGILLQASIPGQADVYFLNSPRGRSAVQAIQRNEWRPASPGALPLEMLAEQPNIFRLYEENFGPITPLIADALRDAEDTYPAGWIAEAIQIAVENNVRNWRYVTAILNRWQLEGRNERQDRRNTEKDRRRYLEGEYSDFIEH